MNITHQYSQVTDWFFQTLQRCLEKQKIVTILLPGGHSLDGWYASILGDLAVWRGIDTTRLRWGLVDERTVSPDSPDRNDTSIWKNFLEPSGFDMSQFVGLGSEVDALLYSEKIGTPDIAFFGLGPDGHIASLFPYHPALLCQVEGYIGIYDSPKPPTERITLTVTAIQIILYTVLFAVGPEKQEAFDAFLHPEKSFLDCPAKILIPDIIFRG